MTDATNARGGEEPVAHPEPVDVKAAVERLAEDVKTPFGHFAGEDEETLCLAHIADLRTALSLIDRLQADNERLVDERDRLRSGLEEILCWFGEAPHTFPDWKTCAECLSEIAQNVLDGLPPLTDPEARQRLQCSGAGDPT